MLQLSTYFIYGIRTLIVLAAKSADKPVALKVLSEEQGISKKYLEIIYSMLRKAGIIRGVKGVGGGYELSVPPRELTLLDIMNAVEGPLRLIDSTRNESASERTKRHPELETWKEFEEHIKSFLQSKSLEDLTNEYKKSKKNFKGMFI
jgi:Rrf2 family protein